MPLPDLLLAEDRDCPFFFFPHLLQTRLVKGSFSTRLGGVSPPPYDSLNLGSTTADDPSNIAENRRRFSACAGHSVRDMIAQVHGSTVLAITEGRGSQEGAALPEADGLVTNLPGVPLTIHLADCLSLFVLDPGAPAIGLAHAGWRGTVQDIGGAVVREMKRRYGTDPAACLAGIGPGLGPCCFLVDEDVASVFHGAFPSWEDLIHATANKWSIDLAEVNRRLLCRAGLKDGQIASGSLCTSCRADLFFSYRRDGRVTGRMAATLVLES